jgi:nucleoside-diphosphate-sugar epimerase
MTTPTPVAAVTGASGYLGSIICTTLEARGWHIVRLVRSSSRNQQSACAYDLAAPVTSQVKELLHSTDVLVHAAYDLSLTRGADIWRVNVEGTRQLLEAASDAHVRRIIVLSSMSAFEGTSQLYGRAKLDIEAMTAEYGGCAVRPGLVYGERSGGMAAALRKLTKLPIVPVIAGGNALYTVSEDDLVTAIAALSETEALPPGTISVTHPTPVTLSDLLIAFAAQEGRCCRFVPVPWHLVYGLLRTAEVLRLRSPFRADSLLGLVRTVGSVSDCEQLGRLGVTPRAFALEPVDQG